MNNLDAAGPHVHMRRSVPHCTHGEAYRVTRVRQTLDLLSSLWIGVIEIRVI